MRGEDAARQKEGGAAQGRRGFSPLRRLADSTLMQLALVAVVGLLAYSNTFHVPFVIDDEGSITGNPVIKNLSSFLFDGTGYRYNPRRFVGYLTFALNYRLGGLDVTGYHAFNTAVHLANAALIFTLLRLTPRTPLFRPQPHTAERPSPEGGIDFNRLVPLIAALLFVAHPIQTQAVTYVVQRLAALATTFYLSSLLCYVLARLHQEDSGKPFGAKPILCYLSALVCAVLAMKTKEITFTLPLTIALYEFSFFGASLKKRILFLLPVAVTLVIVPLGLMHSGKPIGDLLGEMDALARETRTISRGDYLLTQFSVIVTYLRLLVLPVRQNLDYDYPVYHSLFTPRVLCSALLLLLLFGLALWLYRLSSGRAGKGGANPRLRLAGFGLLWFFITLGVESSVIPIRDVIFEHRAYLPAIGIFCAVAVLCAPLLARLDPRRGAAILAVAVLALTVTTWQRNLVWGSGVRLWQDCADKAPAKVRPRNNLAIALMNEWRVDEALLQLKSALELAPGDADALRNLGAAYEKKGGIDEAIAQYQTALGANPRNKYAHYNLGVSYSKKGRSELAAEQFQLALQLDPEYADAHNNLGVIYGNQGMMDQAVEQFRLAVRFDPRSAEGHKNLGFALGMGGRLEQGIEELRTAATLQPGNAEVYNSMGVLYANRRLFQEAAEQFRRAAELRPEEPKYLDNLYRARLQGA